MAVETDHQWDLIWYCHGQENASTCHQPAMADEEVADDHQKEVWDHQQADADP